MKLSATREAMTADARSKQRNFYDEECNPEFEIARPYNCGRVYEFLIEHRFRTGVDLLGLELAGRSVLEVCCGSGMMSQKFALAGALVTGIDMSSAAVARARERARRYHFTAHFLVGDAENLAFADQSFDIAAVHDGLHHLDDPQRAVREMARVAREGVLVLDPARAALTRLAMWLRVAKKTEEAGNEVKRLVAKQVAATLREEGFCRASWRRTLMYYPHEPSGWLRRFDSNPLFAAFRVSFSCANHAFGRWGNKLALASRRR
jgi:ubiquinone/menaquinone biosynthesis C-methylase UbiE